MPRNPIGAYSGSERLDPKKFEEPDSDVELTYKLWLEDTINDPDFLNDIQKEIESWKRTIAITANPEKLDIHVVGESHIDMAWLWRFEQTHRKGIKTFKKAVLHANRIPDFCFASSQPCLLWWLKNDDPTLFEEVKQTIKKGGIELVGGSWVEPDCMMPSGEAFVRQRLYGMKFYNDNFGILPETEWFLDSFGYNLGLPQILKKSGAKYFWTSKITWNRQTVFPFVNFKWEGPDGSQLLTANFQMAWSSLRDWIRWEIGRHPIREGAKQRWNYKDNYEDIADHIDEDPDHIIPPIGVFHGRGDGGHGPTHQEVAEDCARVKMGFGKWSRAENFFKALEKYDKKLPIWSDELYLEYHRGTFSNHIAVKRHNRLFEHQTVAVEGLSALLSVLNPTYLYPQAEFWGIWSQFLLNQFHDCLPGSSIPEVYDDLFDSWQDFKNSLQQTLVNWSNALVVPLGTQITLSNPLGWKRKSPVFIPIISINQKITLQLDPQGRPPYIRLVRIDDPKEILLCQPSMAEVGDSDETRPAGWWTVIDLEAFATKCYKIEIVTDPAILSAIKQSPFQINSTQISTDQIKLQISPLTGAITEWNIKGLNKGQNIFVGTRNNLTIGFVDDWDSDHAWNLKQEYWKYPLVIPNDKDVKITLVEQGPIFMVFQITRILGDGPAIQEKLQANHPIGASLVTQKITLFKDDPILYLTYETDWKQPWLMLKVQYDTATKAITTVSDQMYCAIERSTIPETPCDKARYEKIMHNYADLSTPDCQWGIALLNEGRYAYDAFAGSMRLTMLRTPRYPRPAGESWVHTERKIRKDKFGTEPPIFSGLGFMRCRYGLFPHHGGALSTMDGKPNSIVKRIAEEFNVPVIVQSITSGVKTGTSVQSNGASLLTVEPNHILITAIKQKEWINSKNLILRVVEVAGYPSKNSKINIHPEIASKVKNVNCTDLLERKLPDQVKWDATKGQISFTIGKFEILTFELEV